MTKLERELIEEKFKGVYQHQEANFTLINQKLESILVQTTKTNGRVTNLEQYRWKIIGASVAISTIFGVAVALLKFWL